MKEKLMVPVMTVMVVGGTLMSVSPAFAQSPMATTQNQGSQPLIKKISQRFGLKEDEVRAVFDESRQERHQQLREHLQQRLDQAVSNGKLTDAQKQALLNKHQELYDKWQKNRDEYQNLTPEQRRERRDQAKTELEQWAKDNGIDLDNLFANHFRRRMF